MGLDFSYFSFLISCFKYYLGSYRPHSIVSVNSVCLPGFQPHEAARLGLAPPPSGVTGSLVRSQGAMASNGGALHLVSRPQEAGKQNLLLHDDLRNPQPSLMA